MVDSVPPSQGCGLQRRWEKEIGAFLAPTRNNRRHILLLLFSYARLEDRILGEIVAIAQEGVGMVGPVTIAGHHVLLP
jgi:hypothetical protein